MSAGSGETLSPQRGLGGSAPGLLRLGLIFAGFIFVFDQLTKWFVLDVLWLPEVQNIPLFSAGPFGLDLTMVWNRGVTFGLFFGAVVDFVDAHAWGWHWYVFNVADAAIVCGVGVLLLDALLPPRRTPKDSA